MDNKKKPCPFCGNEKVYAKCVYGKYGRFVFIKCDVCGAQCGSTKVGECNLKCKDGEFCDDADYAESIATNKWNRRDGADQ